MGALKGRVVFFFLLSSTITFLAVKTWPNRSTEHFSVTSSNIVESNMLHSFGHHVVVMLEVVE